MAENSRLTTPVVATVRGDIFHLTGIGLLKPEIFCTRANTNERPKQRAAIVSKFHERPRLREGVISIINA